MCLYKNIFYVCICNIYILYIHNVYLCTSTKRNDMCSYHYYRSMVNLFLLARGIAFIQ